MSRLIQSFYENADFTPNKIAVRCEDEEITYKELASKVKKYAYTMSENNILYGDHIAFPMNNSIDSVTIMLAAATIGAAIVPFNASMPSYEIENMIRLTDVKHLIARKNFLQRVDVTVKGTVICIDEVMSDYPNFIEVNQEIKDMPALNGKETFIITMTSGSTGNPKPILLTQNDKLKRVKAHISLYKLNKNDIILTATPLYHSLAERLVLLPLFLGATSVVIPRFSSGKWLENISLYKVTFTIAVSAQLAQINKYIENGFDTSKLKSLRILVSSSALLEPKVKEQLIHNLQCDFYEIYGTSEISTATSINFKNSLKKNASVGYPLEETKILIIDEHNNKCENNKIGEIACKTDLICSGYYKREDIFENNLCEGYFKTGDLGYLDEDGYLYFTGRKKEVIITGGINVYPPDIERVVSAVTEVEECAAFAYPDENLGECVALAIIGEKHLKRKIQMTCAKNLSDYQQPLKFFFLKELPKNNMGKIMKYKLSEYVGEINEY